MRAGFQQVNLAKFMVVPMSNPMMGKVVEPEKRDETVENQSVINEQPKWRAPTPWPSPVRQPSEDSDDDVFLPGREDQGKQSLWNSYSYPNEWERTDELVSRGAWPNPDEEPLAMLNSIFQEWDAILPVSATVEMSEVMFSEPGCLPGVWLDTPSVELETTNILAEAMEMADLF